MVRLIILVERPRQVTTDEAESWLHCEIGALHGDGVESVALRRLCSPSLHLVEPWAWIVELQCRDREAAGAAVSEGAGLALVADLRLLGMQPSLALVEDAD